jgi:hypothetical protein
MLPVHMDPLLVLKLVRLAKLLAAFAFVAGSLGAVVPGDIERQRLMAYRLAGPGFGLTWCFGILLTFLTGTSLISTFVIAGFGLSLVTLHAVLYSAGPRRPSLALAARHRRHQRDAHHHVDGVSSLTDAVSSPP